MHEPCGDSFYILACPRGTYGLNCSDNCPEDWYGLLCGQKYHCSTDQYCDLVHGCSGFINLDISIFHRILAKIWLIRYELDILKSTFIQITLYNFFYILACREILCPCMKKM